jgi:hypothetical protein
MLGFDRLQSDIQRVIRMTIRMTIRVTISVAQMAAQTPPHGGHRDQNRQCTNHQKQEQSFHCHAVSIPKSALPILQKMA